MGQLPGSLGERLGTPLPPTRRAYEAIAHELLVLILGGHLAPGDRLPSERQLAARFGVSRPTVREALGALEARGLVVHACRKRHVRRRAGGARAAPEARGRRQSGRVHGDAPPARGRASRAARRQAGGSIPRRAGGACALSVEALERVADPEVLPDELDRDFHRGVVAADGERLPRSACSSRCGTRCARALFATLHQRELVGGRHAREPPSSTGRSTRRCASATRARRRSRWNATCARSWRRCSRTRPSTVRRRASSPTTMFTVTDGIVLPTTVTGSWPRPALVHEQPRGAIGVGRPRRLALPGGVHGRGRDGHLRPGAGRARHPHERRLSPRRRSRQVDRGSLYPVERLRRASPASETVPASDEWVYPPGLAARRGVRRLAAAAGRRPGR